VDLKAVCGQLNLAQVTKTKIGLNAIDLRLRKIVVREFVVQSQVWSGH